MKLGRLAKSLAVTVNTKRRAKGLLPRPVMHFPVFLEHIIFCHIPFFFPNFEQDVGCTHQCYIPIECGLLHVVTANSKYFIIFIHVYNS